jgi:hypothetical protein
MTFLQYAQKAQKELDGELARVKQMEADLNIKASGVATQEATNDQRSRDLNAFEKELQRRNEIVAQRELHARREEEVQKDLDTSVALQKDAAEEKKRAQELRDEAQMKIEDLERRERALSDARDKYKQEVEHEVMTNFMFRK